MNRSQTNAAPFHVVIIGGGGTGGALAHDLVLRGVATVEDVDKAVSCGPGLRWAAMGPHLLYDLGGGEEGIAGHVEHLAAVKEGMLRDLATWTSFPPETAETLATGLAEEKGARGYDELVAAGSMDAAKSVGKIRVEGKEYEVQEGDILHVRFAV